MKTFGTHAFVNQLVIGLVVTLGFGGTVGLGTVWMRHRVSVVADENAALQRQLVEVGRRITDLSALVEQAKSEDVLRSENESMHLGLVPMTLAQINPVPVDPVARLVARANRRIFAQEGDAGVGIALNLDAPTPGPSAGTRAAPAGRARPPVAVGITPPQFAVNP